MIKNNINKINQIRKVLKKKLPCIGTFIQLADTNSAEIIIDNGYDWLAFDLEHGNISLSDLNNLIRVVDNSKSVPLVRLGSCSEYECKKVFEAGALGVIIPMVKNVENLNKIYEYSTWPPLGKRGVGYSRSNLYGKYFNEYMTHISQKPIFIPMIENIECVDNLEELMKLEYVDAFFIGPYDLSASLKVPGDFKNITYTKTLNYIKKISKIYNKPLGIHLIEPNTKKLNKLIKDNYKFVAYSLDTVFLRYNSNFKI